MKRLRTAAAVLAAAVLVMCSACSGETKKSDSIEKTDSSKTTDADSTLPDENSSSEQSEQPTAANGKYIMNMYELMRNSSYSLRMTYTDFEGNISQVYRVADRGNFYQLQKSEKGESGSIRSGAQCYDFDITCGIYRVSSSARLSSFIQSVVEEDLPATSTHINPQDAEKYAVEEYTYTGTTYITVVDFYFSKETGLLKKYTINYMVEEENGDESKTETAVINYLRFSDADGIVTDGELTDAQDDIDDSVFDTEFISGLVNFNEMTEEQRLGYCQAIFVTAGVTAEELNDARINDEMLKNISYEDFTSLVYEYGFDTR